MKRVAKDIVRHLSYTEAEVISNPNKFDITNALKDFNVWIETAKFPINKLRLGAVDGMRIGAFSSSRIRNDEVYLSVPQSLVIDKKSANSCPIIGEVISDLVKKHGAGDDFHEVSFSLLELIIVMPAALTFNLRKNG